MTNPKIVWYVNVVVKAPVMKTINDSWMIVYSVEHEWRNYEVYGSSREEESWVINYEAIRFSMLREFLESWPGPCTGLMTKKKVSKFMVRLHDRLPEFYSKFRGECDVNALLQFIQDELTSLLPTER